MNIVWPPLWDNVPEDIFRPSSVELGKNYHAGSCWNWSCLLKSKLKVGGLKPYVCVFFICILIFYLLKDDPIFNPICLVTCKTNPLTSEYNKSTTANFRQQLVPWLGVQLCVARPSEVVRSGKRKEVSCFSQHAIARWWQLKHFSFSHLLGEDFPIWLIFFKPVETTN